MWIHRFFLPKKEKQSTEKHIYPSHFRQKIHIHRYPSYFKKNPPMKTLTLLTVTLFAMQGALAQGTISPKKEIQNIAHFKALLAAPLPVVTFGVENGFQKKGLVATATPLAQTTDAPPRMDIFFKMPLPQSCIAVPANFSDTHTAFFCKFERNVGRKLFPIDFQLK